ncbi:MAG: glycosyltransferase family 4 protein [Anaerolineae bacterium]
MRIGLDARILHHSHAGIAQYVRGLVRGLDRVLEESMEEILLLQSRKDLSPPHRGARFPRRPLWTPSHHRLEQWILPLELLPLRLDLLHSPDFIPPLRRTFRSVITVHDLAFLRDPAILTAQSSRYYGQVGRAAHSADRIVVPSHATQRDAVELLGVSPEKVTVIPEAADPQFQPWDGDEEALSAEASRLGVEGPFLLFVGTLEPRKNLPLLLRAYRQLLDEAASDIRLVIAGRPGWLYQEIFDLTEELKLSDEVLFLSHVPPEDLRLLYCAAEIYLHPASYEGFGLPPLEAMACGTPVVAAATSSLPEVVGDAGILVDPADAEAWTAAIHRLLAEPALRTDLKERGLARAGRFSWDETARKTLAVYRSVLSQG